jgi:hypothetical protein
MNELQAIDDTEESRLPKLTPKQFKFVQGAVDPKKTLITAYRDAYNTQAADNACGVEAARLKQTPAIQEWLNYYRLMQARTIDYTLDNHFSELEECRQLGSKLGNVSGMVAATRAKGEVAGHYRGKVDSSKVFSPVLIQVGQILGDDIAKRLISNSNFDSIDYNMQHECNVTGDK